MEVVGASVEEDDVLADPTLLDIDETPPVELLAKVQEWQDELEESDADAS